MRLYGILTYLFCAGLLQAQSDTVPPSTEFAVITIERPSVRILSDAYLHYDFVPGRSAGGVADTVTFEQRYLSHNYCRVTPKWPSRLTGKPTNTSFKVNPVKNNVSDKVAFKLNIRHGFHQRLNLGTILYSPVSFEQYFPEMRAFRNYHWIIEGPAERKTFRRDMKHRRWYDIRLYYEQGDEHFTIELKGEHHTFTLAAYPVRNHKLIPANMVRPDPERLYKQYLRTLKRIERQFNSRLRRMSGRRGSTDSFERWPRFYFSEEERAMNREEWLEYYADVVFNEAEYLPDAPYYQSLLIRYLELNGFMAGSTNASTSRQERRFRLDKEVMGEHQIEGVLFINPGSLTWYRQEPVLVARDGTFGCNVATPANCIAIIELSDGNILVAEQITREQGEATYRLQATLFQTDILTIGALTGYLGL